MFWNVSWVKQITYCFQEILKVKFELNYLFEILDKIIFLITVKSNKVFKF